MWLQLGRQAYRAAERVPGREAGHAHRPQHHAPRAHTAQGTGAYERTGK